jgi:hypothetical protein
VEKFFGFFLCHSVERRRGVKMESWRSEETESSLGEEMELRWGHVAQKVISSESCVPAGVGPNGAFWG